MDDPLAAKLYIDQARWGALETMLGTDNMFGVENVFAHLLKLQLLERYQRLVPETGAEKYRERYDAILDEYNSKV